MAKLYHWKSATFSGYCSDGDIFAAGVDIEEARTRAKEAVAAATCSEEKQHKAAAEIEREPFAITSAAIVFGED